MRMRRTFNVIISCFIVGLIFYEGNHSYRTSCTVHIPPHPEKGPPPFLVENLFNLNIFLNCLYRSEMSRCRIAKMFLSPDHDPAFCGRPNAYLLCEANISASELKFTLKVPHVIAQLLTVCRRWRASQPGSLCIEGKRLKFTPNVAHSIAQL